MIQLFLTYRISFVSFQFLIFQETIDAISHSGTLPMSIVIVNVAEGGKGEDDSRLQVLLTNEYDKVLRRSLGGSKCGPSKGALK